MGSNSTNYIGIHIRKGDKKEEAPDIPLEEYINKIGQIFQEGKQISKEIFVASDDFQVIGQLRQLKAEWTFLSLYDDHLQSFKTLGHYQKTFNRLSKEQKLNETRLLMCELQMLINAQYVLCGMSSNVCRLVQILRYQDPSTAISMDQLWSAT